MLYLYILIAAVAVPILNKFFDIFVQPYSWWLTPLLVIAIFLALLITHFIVFLIMILTVEKFSNTHRLSRVFRFLLKDALKVIIFLARVKIHSKGLEKLPDSDEPMLFVSNHLHDFDPIILLSQFPNNKLAFIGKKEIFETMPFVSKAMKLLESLPIDRENDREAAKTIIKAIKLIKDKTASVALFPEGYVSKSGELLPLRNGSLKIAIKTNCPIVVCVMDNTPTIFKNMFRRKTDVSFRLIEVIYPEQYEGMNTTQLGNIIYEKMLTALSEIRG